MSWHGYLHVYEAPPGWAVEERNNAKNALKGMGKQSDAYAHNINATRPNLANTAWIIEALFEDDELTRSHVAQLIADALNMEYAAVDAKIEYEQLANAEAARAIITSNIEEWEEAIT